MNKKHSIERRFIARLEHTKSIFGYISLETIVNGQLKKQSNFRLLTLKKVDKIVNAQRKPSSIPECFKEHNRNKSTQIKNN